MKNMTKSQLQAEVIRLQAQVATKAPVLVPGVDKDKPRTDLKFVDLKGGKAHTIQIKCDRDMKAGEIVAQVVTTQLVSWDKETRGILNGSWLKQTFEKPRGVDGKMIPVIEFLEGKNKKGFMYRGEIPVQVEAEPVLQSV